ncbi:hypothetical protein TA3x_000418 [Tundrisphaera sp. TA3]|uniref:hypothetical protein n=1 Tax=Tundrisphaera sp. TA3 TaxID=3435775 RepID=UPI003EB8631F
MGKFKGRRAAIFIAAGLLIAVMLQARAEEPKQADAKLAKDLIGTWTLEEAKTPGSPSGVGSRLKFFTGTHWMITQPDPKTGKVIFHHGGRYTLDGDTMAGTVDFANENTAAMIGQTHKFKISVEGDVYKQTGLDSEFTETWKRVK